MKKTQIKSSERWLILFMGISFFILLSRSFIFDKLEKIQRFYFSSDVNQVSLLVLASLVLLTVVSFFIIYSINSEIKKEKNITREFGVKNIKEFFAFCMKFSGFRTLLYFNLFIIFINSFLSDFFERKGHLVLNGVLGFMLMLITSFVVTFFIFLGFLIATKGIKKNIFLKILLLILVIIIPITVSFIIYVILGLDLFLLS